jgi:asparagine synthase (glutamine-hydrolysing)
LGADDICTGYRRHQLIALYRLLHWVPFKRLHQLFSKVLTKNGTFIRRLNKAATAWHEDENTFLLNLLLYSQLNRKESCSFLENGLNKMASDVTLIDKALALEQMSYLPNQNLLYTDKASMKYGVEVRVPYLDNELCDYIYNIPAQLKMKGLETKYILKEIAKKYLPKEIIYRKKVGFSEPIDDVTEQELLKIIQKSPLSYYLEEPQISKQLLLNLYASIKFSSL